MIYGVLGDLVVLHGGERLPLPNGRDRSVLACLLVNANRQVPTDELLHAGWGRLDVDHTQLHKSITAMRGVLKRVDRLADLVTYRGIGYELKVAVEDDVDVLTFRRLVLQAEDAKLRREVDEEVGYLRAALQLWRGLQALSNVGGHGFRQVAVDLEHKRKRVAVRLLELELERGRHTQVPAELFTIARYHPTDQRLTELAMLAQHRGAHGSEAAGTYRRHAEALARRQGSRPEPRVRQLNYAIAGGDEEVVATLEAQIIPGLRSAADPADPAATVLVIPRQLPPAPSDLVGRDDVRNEGVWLLGRNPAPTAPVLVISGPGGMGKTALSLRLAHQVAAYYPGGQLYAELHGNASPIADPDEVLAGFLRALGVTHVPETSAERVSTYRTLLADRRVLVVLDDAHDEQQLQKLIPGNAGCAVLVTARQRLPDVDGVHHLPPLTALEPPVAGELFRSVIARSDVPLPGEPAEVERVLELCAGLPLALRVAAALYVRDYPRPITELAGLLATQALDVLTYGQRNVARTISVGFDRLDVDAQRLFLSLGLTRLPEFEAWTAAATLDGTAASATATLAQLAGYHMVEPIGGGRRFRFHDLTREYARRRGLAELADDDRQGLLEHVYGALLTLVRRGHRRLAGGDYEVVHADTADWAAPAGALADVDASPLRWFERERSNIRAAIDHSGDLGRPDLAWDLALSTQEYYATGRYFDDWYATHTAALAATRAAGDQRGEAMMLVGLAQPALMASRRAGGVSGPDDLQRAVDLLTDSGDEHGLAIAERTLANALRRRGQLARPLALLTRAMGRFDASQDALGQWQTLRFIGQTHLDRGDHAEALKVLTLALAAAEQLDATATAQTWYWIGQAQLADGALAEAQTAFEFVDREFGRSGGAGQAYALHGLGDVARRSDQLERAADQLGRAVALAKDAADARLEGRLHLSLADLELALGNPARQVAELEDAIACFTEGDAVYLEMVALAALSRAEAAQGNDTAAAAGWARVEDRYAAMNLPAEDRIHRHP